jgi:hypothetical protein
MAESEIIFYIIKLVLGGVAAFLAIMLWSHTRDSAWMSLVAGAVTGYAGIVYEMLVKLGIAGDIGVKIAGIPLASLLFAVIPSVFYITAFVLMIIRTK